jgi:hypothetical protein
LTRNHVFFAPKTPAARSCASLIGPLRSCIRAQCSELAAPVDFTEGLNHALKSQSHLGREEVVQLWYLR